MSLGRALPAESLAQALGGRRSGAGWIVHCPNKAGHAHGDRTPSLSVREVDGTVLVKCFVCPRDVVIAALKQRGLWFERERRGYPPEWGRFVRSYDYTDEHGELLYQVCRFEPKTFRPRYPDGRGGWTWKKHPHQVLYHLPEILEAAIVFVTEGERDVETLREHGFVATTNAGGAKAAWLPQFTEALRGREVIILPDADLPGRRRALVIARALLGKAARLVILELENAKDVTEWFSRGHSEVELIAQLDGEEVAR